MSELHTMKPSVIDAVLEERTLPAVQQVLLLSTLQLGGLSTFMALGGGSLINTSGGSTGSGSNAGLGVGFSSQFSSGYAINAGMGEGPGGFVGGAGGAGGSSLAALLGGPSVNPFGASLGSSAS